VGIVFDGTGLATCTGFLLSPSIAMTAAHCNKPNLSFTISPVVHSVGETTPVDYVMTDPTYSPGGGLQLPNDDVMLLHLATPIHDVLPLTMLSSTKQYPKVGDTCQATGYGSDTQTTANVIVNYLDPSVICVSPGTRRPGVRIAGSGVVFLGAAHDRGARKLLRQRPVLSDLEQWLVAFPNHVAEDIDSRLYPVQLQWFRRLGIAGSTRLAGNWGEGSHSKGYVAINWERDESSRARMVPFLGLE
jgi:hypothetical protein